MKKCHYCNQEKLATDVRPYGPNREYMCYICMSSSEDLKKCADDQISSFLDEIEKDTNIVLFSTEGPVPVYLSDVLAFKGFKKYISIEKIYELLFKDEEQELN